MDQCPNFAKPRHVIRQKKKEGPKALFCYSNSRSRLELHRQRELPEAAFVVRAATVADAALGRRNCSAVSAADIVKPFLDILDRKAALPSVNGLKVPTL